MMGRRRKPDANQVKTTQAIYTGVQSEIVGQVSKGTTTRTAATPAQPPEATEASPTLYTVGVPSDGDCLFHSTVVELFRSPVANSAFRSSPLGQKLKSNYPFAAYIIENSDNIPQGSHATMRDYVARTLRRAYSDLVAEQGIPAKIMQPLQETYVKDFLAKLSELPDVERRKVLDNLRTDSIDSDGTLNYKTLTSRLLGSPELMGFIDDNKDGLPVFVAMVANPNLLAEGNPFVSPLTKEHLAGALAVDRSFIPVNFVANILDAGRLPVEIRVAVPGQQPNQNALYSPKGGDKPSGTIVFIGDHFEPAVATEGEQRQLESLYAAAPTSETIALSHPYKDLEAKFIQQYSEASPQSTHEQLQSAAIIASLLQNELKDTAVIKRLIELHETVVSDSSDQADKTASLATIVNIKSWVAQTEQSGVDTNNSNQMMPFLRTMIENKGQVPEPPMAPEPPTALAF